MSSQRWTKLSKYIPLHKRWIPKYPIYTKGDPQLRVYMPLFWMKLVKPDRKGKLNPDTVQFHVHPQMTKMDVKNYLEKIYKVPVLNVTTTNVRGEEMKDPKTGSNIGYEPDTKVAYVRLAEGQTFEFPDITERDSKEESKEMADYKKMLEAEKANIQENWDKVEIPSWFR